MDLDLNPQQLAAAQAHTSKHVQILAGPGTGKTKTLVNRVIWLLQKGIPPDEILVLTFTNRAVDIFRHRLQTVASTSQSSNLQHAAQVNVHTFHSYCQTLLSTVGPLVGFADKYAVADDQDQEYFYSEAWAQNHELPLKKGSAQLKDLTSHKRLLVQHECDQLPFSPDIATLSVDYLEPYVSPSTLKVLKSYNTILAQANMIDYSDLLLAGKHLIDHHAHRVKKTQVVLVDEFQDSSPFQWALVRDLCRNQGAHMTVVGDPDQSIFGFQGAHPAVFDTMWTEYEGDVDRIVLKTNYRSSNQVVAASTAVMRADNAGDHHYLRDADLPHGTYDSDAVPQLCENVSSGSEIQWIASEARNLLSSDPSLRPCDIGILARTNYMRDAVATQLRRAGFAVSVYGTMPSFLRSPAVAPLYMFLKFARNCDDTYFHRLVRDAPSGKVGSLVTHARLRQLLAAARAHSLSLWDIFRDPHTHSHLLDHHSVHAPHSRRAASKLKLAEFTAFGSTLQHALDLLQARPWCVKTLVTALQTVEPKLVRQTTASRHDLRQRQQSQLFAMIEQMASKMSPDTDHESLVSALVHHARIQDLRADPNEIVASTVHGAKGLEWRVVFVCDASSNNFRLKDPEDRRVLYVGMTRARERLYLSYNTETPMWGQDCIPRRLTPIIDDSRVLPHFERRVAAANFWLQKFRALNLVRLKYPRVFPMV